MWGGGISNRSCAGVRARQRLSGHQIFVVNSFLLYLVCDMGLLFSFVMRLPRLKKGVEKRHPCRIRDKVWVISTPIEFSTALPPQSEVSDNNLLARKKDHLFFSLETHHVWFASPAGFSHACLLFSLTFLNAEAAIL